MSDPVTKAWSVRILRALVDWVSGCFGKARFGTYGQALRVCDSVGHRKRAALRPYLCRFCEWYHVGPRR